MTTQEIGLIVVLVVIAGYVIAALLSRSKSGEAPADIMLESRLPKATAAREVLIPAVDASMQNTRKPRRKSARARRAETEEETAATVKTQQHHESPKRIVKSDRKTAEAKTAPSEAATRPVRPVVAPAPKLEPDPAPEAIDPKLTGQISELDDRLDAIEKLVTSIEESLAAFDDSPAGEVQAA